MSRTLDFDPAPMRRMECSDRMEGPLKTRLLTAMAAVCALVLLPITPASAQVVRFDDAVGDTHARSDIKWVQVTNSRHRDLFKVRVRLDRVRYGVGLVVYVDRRLKNPGPELRMVAFADSEWQLHRVNKWGQRGRMIDTCGAVRYSKSTPRPIATWKASRSCLELRPRVRVAVKIADRGHGKDWAPDRRRFFPPVSASSHAS